MINLVCLLKTVSLEEARVIESLLIAHDIPAVLGEADMARAYWVFMTISGIRVLVPEDRLEDAKSVLLSARVNAATNLRDEFGELDASPSRRDRWIAWTYLGYEWAPSFLFWPWFDWYGRMETFGVGGFLFFMWFHEWRKRATAAEGDR